MGRYAQASRRGRPRGPHAGSVESLSVSKGDFIAVTWTSGSGSWTVEVELEWGGEFFDHSATWSASLQSGGGETPFGDGETARAKARARVIDVTSPQAWSDWAEWYV